MIFIDRNNVEKPSVLEEKIETHDENGELKLIDSKATIELQKNINFAANGEHTKMKYNVYKDVEVRKTLETLFNEKCAYCESRFRHVYTGDIEHFRPKGKIQEATPQTPGYYWLAADCDNLLLSCRHCNQTYTHEIYGIVNNEAKGKLNQFPLREQHKHVQSHIDAEKVSEEEKYRLLINPCIENPEEYFEYTDEGIIKSNTSDSIKKQMANTSIDVYALQRMPLVQAREKVLIEIKLQMQRVREVLYKLNEYLAASEHENETIYYNKLLYKELKKLKSYKDSNKEYAGMARYFINQFIEAITG